MNNFSFAALLLALPGAVQADTATDAENFTS